jgi:hypothetical protein
VDRSFAVPVTLTEENKKFSSFISSWVKMENLVHDFPFTVDFQQRKEISKAMPGPIVEFQSHRGNSVNEIYRDNSALEFGRWAILIVPIKEFLDRAGEQIRANIAKDCRVLVEGGFHIRAAA